MAYVLGYIYADGTLINAPYMRGKYISLTSKDKDSLLRVRGWLDSEHRIVKKRTSGFIKMNVIYLLRIGSHKIYDDLVKRGLFQNKSLTVGFPKVPQKYLGHFVRGYFDGDGCINFQKGIGSKNQVIIKRIRTIFTCGSKKFLTGLMENLEENGVKNGKIYFSQRAYQLKYPNGDSINLFKVMYGNAGTNSFFMRKFSIFKEYFELRPQRVDLKIKKILSYHSNGHVVK